MRWIMGITVLAALSLATSQAADNTLSAAEQKQGFVLLFDGKATTGWLLKGDKTVPSTCVKDGTLNPHFQNSGGLLYTKGSYGNFVLSCDFKVSPRCNSGIFVRVGDPKDEVQTGLEIQVLDSAGKAKPGKHDCGALYDAQAPTRNTMKPAGEWNHIEITADRNVIKVALNGEEIVTADLDKYTEPHKNTDGTKNKYTKALKDFPREGHIGLQDHGGDVWYKNLKIRQLK
jgi:hypothetical protein